MQALFSHFVCICVCAFMSYFLTNLLHYFAFFFAEFFCSIPPRFVDKKWAAYSWGECKECSCMVFCFLFTWHNVLVAYEFLRTSSIQLFFNSLLFHFFVKNKHKETKEIEVRQNCHAVIYRKKCKQKREHQIPPEGGKPAPSFWAF